MVARHTLLLLVARVNQGSRGAKVSARRRVGKSFRSRDSEGKDVRQECQARRTKYLEVMLTGQQHGMQEEVR